MAWWEREREREADDNAATFEISRLRASVRVVHSPSVFVKVFSAKIVHFLLYDESFQPLKCPALKTHGQLVHTHTQSIYYTYV